VSSGTVSDAELLLWLPAAPWPLGSLFDSFSPCGARSKGDQQPDDRVAHNRKLLNIFKRFSPPVPSARKTRKLSTVQYMLPARVNAQPNVRRTNNPEGPSQRHLDTPATLTRLSRCLMEKQKDLLCLVMQGITARGSERQISGDGGKG
jgi:hypothetical protein